MEWERRNGVKGEKKVWKQRKGARKGKREMEYGEMMERKRRQV